MDTMIYISFGLKLSILHTAKLTQMLSWACSCRRIPRTSSPSGNWSK